METTSKVKEILSNPNCRVREILLNGKNPDPPSACINDAIEAAFEVAAKHRLGILEIATLHLAVSGFLSSIATDALAKIAKLENEDFSPLSLIAKIAEGATSIASHLSSESVVGTEAELSQIQQEITQ